MAAIEIANLLQAMASFTAANPPVVQRSCGVLTVTRIIAGQYRLTFEETVPVALTPPQIQPEASLASTGLGTSTACVNNGLGGVDVFCIDAAGGLTDGGNVVSFKLWRYPTQG